MHIGQRTRWAIVSTLAVALSLSTTTSAQSLSGAIDVGHAGQRSSGNASSFRTQTDLKAGRHQYRGVSGVR